ncbi:MAG: ATP-binding cassette domain-containing protein [Bacteroidales bacterium]|nr:ATP-binding cassette domain-containing protein [Bacteroidales bacterium]
MIEVQNLYKSFYNTDVLNDISVYFEEKKTNMIIGQSGSGKTVLLKCIIGLLDINSGKIFYDDVVFNKLSFKKKKEIRKNIGMVFQGGALFDSETVEQNVKFPLDMFTIMTEQQKLNRVNECLERVNIVNANSLYPAEISGGMQKRVAIARAIALYPKYLFFDEPISGLDPKTAIRIDRLIGELTRDIETTTIINTHDMNSVMEIGDKVIFLYEGKKWWEGSREEILHSDNPELNEFVFATNLAKTVRNLRKSGHS